MTSFDEFRAAVGRLRPRLAVVLGSGLGSAPRGFVAAAGVGFGDVPGLAPPSVAGHGGRAEVGTLGGRPLLVFRGRLHFYEGHSWDRVAGLVRLAADLGVRTLLLTNAAGGIRADLNVGDLVLLRGHLFLQDPAAWRTASAGPWTGYDTGLIARLRDSERARGRDLPDGVYAAVTGPSFETPAEIRALREMGADLVGMSTAREAETAADLGLAVVAVSCVTNKAAGLGDGPIEHSHVTAAAAGPAERLSGLIAALLS